MAKRIGKFVTILLDDSGGTARDISNDIQSINGMPLNYTKTDSGGYGQDMSYLIGRGDSEVVLSGMFNPTATTGFHTVADGIVGTNTDVTLTIQVGSNAAATTSDPEFEGEFRAQNYVVTPDLNGAVTAELTLVPASGQSLPDWTTVS